MGPCERVWSREISKSLERCEVAEAFEACAIVVSDKTVEEGVAIGMAGKGAPRAAALGCPADGLGDTAVEAFDETVGLRPIRSGQTVVNLVVGADEIERVLIGTFAGMFFAAVDGKAVGEFETH